MGFDVGFEMVLPTGAKLRPMWFPGRKKPLLMASWPNESVQVGIITDLPAFWKALGLPEEEA